MVNSIAFDKTLTNWISTGASFGKIKLFDTNFAATMTNLANGTVSLKFNNSALVQKNSSSLHSNLILNLCIFYELNNRPRNLSDWFFTR